MRKVWLIFKREYLVRVRTKGFIVTTVALPAFSAFVLFLVGLMATRAPDHPLKIALLDDAGLSKNIAAGFSEKLKNGQPLFQLVRTIENPPSEQAARDELAEEVRRGALDGYVVVPRHAAGWYNPAGRSVTDSCKPPVPVSFLHISTVPQEACNCAL